MRPSQQRYSPLGAIAAFIADHIQALIRLQLGFRKILFSPRRTLPIEASLQSTQDAYILRWAKLGATVSTPGHQVYPYQGSFAENLFDITLDLFDRARQQSAGNADRESAA